MRSKFLFAALTLGLAFCPLCVSRAQTAGDGTGPDEPPDVEHYPPHEPLPPAPVQPGQSARPPDGFYYGFTLGVGVAANFPTDADFEVGSAWADNIGFEAGFRLGIFRLGAELGIKSIEVSGLELGPTSPFPPDDYAGSLASASVMANLYVESPFALFGSVRPYAGWGLGFVAAHAQYTPQDCLFGVCSPSGGNVVSDTDSVRSRQFMAGVTIASEMPGAEYYVGYRRFETDNLEFSTEGNVDFIQDGIESHTVFIGVRFSG